MKNNIMGILSIFKKKHKPVYVEMEVEVVGGTLCPKCKQDGGLFHYKQGQISSHPEEFYLCENCLTVFDKDLQVIPKTK